MYLGKSVLNVKICQAILALFEMILKSLNFKGPIVMNIKQTRCFLIDCVFCNFRFKNALLYGILYKIQLHLYQHSDKL